MGLSDEIREQPAVVERLLERAGAMFGPVIRQVRDANIRHVMVAARGSSDHAGVYGIYALGAIGRMPVALAAPSLFSRYERPPSLAGTLVVGISQSGRSPDVVSVLEEAARQRVPSVAITNAPDSPLAQAATFVVDLAAGPERSVAATKTYTAQLAAVAALAAGLGDLPAEGWRELRELPNRMAAALDAGDAAAQLARDEADLEECVVIGRGYNLSTAMEWALKLKELAGVRAQAYSAADYEHGPVASFGRGARLLAVRAAGPMAEDIDRLVDRLVSERGARAVAVAGTAIPGADWLPFPDDGPEWLSPLVAILPMQMFAAALAEAKGMDVERPQGLNKITLTR